MLALDALTFSYRREGPELFGALAHTFASGAVTALTGSSGRGKSTLLYLLGLLLRPRSGAVIINGATTAGLSDTARSAIRAEQIGFVFQDAALDPHRRILDSVIEPALYAGFDRHRIIARAHQLLERVGVTDRAAHRPGEISGGQAQRVAVCRALINDPPIVLADEPTGNLDRDNAQIVLTALRDTATGQNRTVVIASHDPFVLDHADHILNLDTTVPHDLPR